jgi:hypothetical protein
MDWPKLNSPEDAAATLRWARVCLVMWEQERGELKAEVERLRQVVEMGYRSLMSDRVDEAREYLRAEVQSHDS